MNKPDDTSTISYQVVLRQYHRGNLCALFIEFDGDLSCDTFGCHEMGKITDHIEAIAYCSFDKKMALLQTIPADLDSPRAQDFISRIKATYPNIEILTEWPEE